MNKLLKYNSMLDDFDFLQTHPDLRNVIYLVLSGSFGYGTNNANSDKDLRGVLIEDNKYLYVLKTFEQFQDISSDTVIYNLKKLVRLCGFSVARTCRLAAKVAELFRRYNR